MHYFDCYMVPVPRANKAAYEELARISADVLKEYGALRVVECWLDESGPAASSYHAAEVRQNAEDYGRFSRAAGAGTDETVVLSYVEWVNKAARDAGMHKVTQDPRMVFSDRPPVFDGRRLIAAGFYPMINRSNGD